MNFNEKIYKLRKEKGLSQEALAEILNTTRQAVSKWENGQGFPETQKLLEIGNYFEVSIDYLLKESTNEQTSNEKGYYVSYEMAMGYIMNDKKVANYISIGLCFIILSFIPYYLFKESPITTVFFTIIFVVIGVASIIYASVSEDSSYKILKFEPLIFDEKILLDLRNKFNNLKKKHYFIIILYICFIVIGIIPIFLVEKEFLSFDTSIDFHVFSIMFIAIGAYGTIRSISLLDAYELLVENQEYSNKFSVRLMKKIKHKIDRF